MKTDINLVPLMPDEDKTFSGRLIGFENLMMSRAHPVCVHVYNRPFYSCVLSYLAMNASEAGVELALIQTSLLFSCKCQLVSIRTT